MGPQGTVLSPLMAVRISHVAMGQKVGRCVWGGAGRVRRSGFLCDSYELEVGGSPGSSRTCASARWLYVTCWESGLRNVRKMIFRVGSGDANCWSASHQEGELAESAVGRTMREGSCGCRKSQGIHAEEETGINAAPCVRLFVPMWHLRG